MNSGHSHDDDRDRHGGGHDHSHALPAAGHRVPRLLDHLQQCLAGYFDVGRSTSQFEPTSHAVHEHAAHP